MIIISFVILIAYSYKSDIENGEKHCEGKLIFVGSKYCPHCDSAREILKEIQQERNLTILFLDASKIEDRLIMEKEGISVQYTPTLFVDCEEIIGAREKTEYETILGGFL